MAVQRKLKFCQSEIINIYTNIGHNFAIEMYAFNSNKKFYVMTILMTFNQYWCVDEIQCAKEV